MSKILSQFKRHPIFILVFIFGVFVASGIGFAYAHGGDLNLIHSCVKTKNGSIRIIGENGTCASNETALDWPKTAGSSIGQFPLMCGSCNFSNRFLGNLFAGKDLSGAFFAGSTFENSDLRGTNFTNARLSPANFSGAQLQGTNFTNAILDSVIFSFTGDLTSTIFTGASLRVAVFREVNLSGVNLSGLDMTDAVFQDSNLTGANLTGAILTNITWVNTICPDGTNSNSNGNTCIGHL